MAPAPEIEHALLAATELLSVTAVVTVSVYPELTESVPEALLNATELQVLFPSAVKANPLPTIISSPFAGIVPPGQGALGVVELQLPVPVVVTVAAKSSPFSKKIAETIHRKYCIEALPYM